ncbi:MAG: lipopolysaccharide heptosyltransferase I [Magnetococcales bacterium]|nr:lipopolysaccharide heptosyltransferase I [Magnetococcales bacterium]
MKQKVLLVKTSSLGDVLHLLPALSDACRQRPELTFHWLVEEGFAEVAAWHPGVAKVIPVALRRWRKAPLLALRSGELSDFWRTLRAESYDQVVDAQGLLKSACLARLAHGPRSGLDRHSAREPLAALFYQHTFPVDRAQHALQRLRQLLASALQYPLQASPADYGLAGRFPRRSGAEYDWVFLHGTTWPSKQWPESHWVALVRLCTPHGRVLLPWGTPAERARAERIARVAPDRVTVAAKGNLTQLANWLAAAKVVVAVDTGPAHLAAALGLPLIGLYGPTDPHRTGTVGPNQHALQGRCDQLPCLKRVCPLGAHAAIHPPCFDPLSPDQVWRLLKILSEG